MQLLQSPGTPEEVRQESCEVGTRAMVLRHARLAQGRGPRLQEVSVASSWLLHAAHGTLRLLMIRTQQRLWTSVCNTGHAITGPVN